MLNSGIRRFALSMVIAVVAVASCVKDTLKETNNGSAIDFRMATQTRATEATAANIETFYVTARVPGYEANYFTDVPYLKAAGDVFMSSSPYYWPVVGKLHFYAYAPSLNNFGDATLAIDATSQKVTNFVTASRFVDQKDFIVASKEQTKAAGTSGVELQFEHKLSQIEVHAKNANSAYNCSIKGVMIGGMASTGDFNFSPAGAAEWIIDEDANPVNVFEIYETPNEINSFATNIMGPGGNAMLIPQQLIPWNPETKAGAYIAVYAHITTAEGALVYPRPADGVKDGYEWLVVPIDTEWLPGYKYIYTLDFSQGAGTDFSGVPVLGDKIHFAVDEIDWNHMSTVQTTAADFIGTWDVVLCESWRHYREDYTPSEEQLKNWPPYDKYDTEEELGTTGKVPQDMRRTRVINENTIQIYPGIDGWEVNLGFKIKDGYLYITAQKLTGEIVESKYPIIDYSKDSFTMYTGNQAGNYYLEKIYYYKKVGDNDAGNLEGRWELMRGTCYDGYYHPDNNAEPDNSIDISTIDPRLTCIEVENNIVTYIDKGDESVALEGDNFILDGKTYTFKDVKTSTMLLKYYPYENNTTYVNYLYYKRIY